MLACVKYNIVTAQCIKEEIPVKHFMPLSKLRRLILRLHK
jgi:hypothetical protein